MPSDIDSKILRRLLDKGLLQLDELVESGVVEEPAIDRMMEEILAEEKEQHSSSQAEVLSLSTETENEVIGRYQDLELLAEGGMAKVYKAYDPELKRNVALKFLRIEDVRLKERLLREARAQAGIDHPNICKVYEVGELQGRPYIAMQHLEGITLKEAAGQLGLEQKVVLIKQVAESLQEAHRLGLIHRDIKPSNIMVEANESGQWIPYLVDFGLARQIAEAGETLTDFIVGTPSYMSPEQAAGKVHSDRRSDIYSLGVTFYQLLCDQLPYKQSDTPMVQSVITEEAISLRKRNSAIPYDLETIVMNCLEKEPERRYESARAFAEDLQRYLNGEPILAKPARLGYRLLKKAKKNKIAATIFSVAVLITLVLTGMLVWTEWRSRQQTKYANEFSQEARYIESMTRSVYMSPLHDIRPELAKAESRLLKLEGHVKQAGKYAYGPGQNSLGQGYLALREYEKARKHLEEAWNSGYRESPTAYALGQVLGFLYQKALSEAEQIGNKEIREQKKREIEKEYRDPAVSFLKSASGNVESTSYVEGLIAFYEKRYEPALAKAREAQTHSSWSYEANKLAGDIYVAMGQEAYDKGEYEAAAKILQAAGKVYGLASEVGRSEPEIYLSNCNRWITTMRLETEQGIAPDGPDGPFQSSVEACDKAIMVNPDSDQPYRMKWESYYRLGEYQLYNTGIDPHSTFYKAIDMSNVVLQKNPDDADSYRKIGTAYQKIGKHESVSGKNPRPAIEKAIHYLEQALQIKSRDISALNYLGLSYSNLGGFQMSRGQDPRPAFRKSIQQYRNALEINPQFGSAYNNMAIVFNDLAQYEGEHGIDPISSHQNSIRSLKKAIALNAQDVYAYTNLAVSYNLLANYQMKHGQNPKEAFDQATVSSESALRINRNQVPAYNNLGGTYTDFGEYLLQHGEDPAGTLRLALKHYNKAIEINPGLIYALDGLGHSYLCAGKYEVMQGKDPVHSLNRAIQKYQKALTVDSSWAVAYTGLGTAYKELAGYDLLQNKGPIYNLRSARSAVHRSIAIDANDYDAYRVLGEIEMIEGIWMMRKHGRSAPFFEASKTAFQKSIQLNSSDAEAYRGAAEVYFWMATVQQQNSVEFLNLVEAGLQKAEKALKVNPEDAKAHAIQGKLYLLKAKQSTDIPERTKLAERAQQSIEAALRINRLLRTEIESYLNEAKRMVRLSSSP